MAQFMAWRTLRARSFWSGVRRTGGSAFSGLPPRGMTPPSGPRRTFSMLTPWYRMSRSGLMTSSPARLLSLRSFTFPVGHWTMSCSPLRYPW